jgi:hypothetical protein
MLEGKKKEREEGRVVGWGREACRQEGREAREKGRKEGHPRKEKMQ